jgi:SAM-dependent methyltransferase
MRVNLEEGYFARKQLFSKSAIIRWSHGRRFAAAVSKSENFAGKRILDFGCGDGTYLAMLMESRRPPAEAVGAEIDANTVADNRKRFASQRALAFVSQSELEDPRFRNTFDGVVCMECFEHMVDPDHYLTLLFDLLKPGGNLLLSVPVETGLPVIAKQAIRRVAGWRKIGDYASVLPYTWSEMGRSVFATSKQHIPRVRHDFGNGFVAHCHKGFNWMALRERIAKKFVIDRISASPIAWLGPHLASQAWFEAHKT